MLLQFDLKHIHKVNFYPSDNNFTQALLVLLVTNMISVRDLKSPKGQGLLRKEGPPTFPIILQLGDHSDPEYRILHHCRL